MMWVAREMSFVVLQLKWSSVTFFQQSFCFKCSFISFIFLQHFDYIVDSFLLHFTDSFSSYFLSYSCPYDSKCFCLLFLCLAGIRFVSLCIFFDYSLSCVPYKYVTGCLFHSCIFGGKLTCLLLSLSRWIYNHIACVGNL